MQSIPPDSLLTHSSQDGVFRAVLSEPMKKGRTHKSRLEKQFRSKAGERIRTADVHLGKHNISNDRNHHKSL